MSIEVGSNGADVSAYVHAITEGAAVAAHLVIESLLVMQSWRWWLRQDHHGCLTAPQNVSWRNTGGVNLHR